MGQFSTLKIDQTSVEKWPWVIFQRGPIFNVTPARAGLELTTYRLLSESTTTRLRQPVTKVHKPRIRKHHHETKYAHILQPDTFDPDPDFMYWIRIQVLCIIYGSRFHVFDPDPGFIYWSRIQILYSKSGSRFYVLDPVPDSGFMYWIQIWVLYITTGSEFYVFNPLRIRVLYIGPGSGSEFYILDTYPVEKARIRIWVLCTGSGSGSYKHPGISSDAELIRISIYDLRFKKFSLKI
jgi:hypothetical protein